MLHDEYEEKRVRIFSKTVMLNEDMQDEQYSHANNICIISYEEINKAFYCHLELLEWENRKIFFKYLIDSFFINEI